MHAISKHVTEKLPNVTLTFDFLFIFFTSGAANELHRGAYCAPPLDS